MADDFSNRSADIEAARRERIKARLDFAESRFARAHADIDQSLGHTIQFGVEAIRTCALINGGAFAACLALAGAAFKDHTVLAGSIAEAAVWFAYGVFLSGVASATAYLAQYAYTRSVSAIDLNWEPPHVTERRSAKLWSFFGGLFHVLAVGAVAAAYGLLIFGAVAFRESFARM